jgi:hypothetical protein
MGYGKRRKKDMVAPQWGTFQRPQQRINREEENYQKQELAQEIPGKLKDDRNPEGEKPQWGNFKSPSTYQGEPDPNADESFLQYLARQATTMSSRIIEQGLGRYGNVEKFAKSALLHNPETGGTIGSAMSELLGQDNWERLIMGPGVPQQMFPTSQQFREASETLSKGYTKPKTKGEERFSNFIEDVGATLNRRGNSLNKNIMIPSAANAVEDIIKYLGFGDDAATKAKMAVWMPLSLANQVNGPQYASNLMNQGRTGIPSNIDINVPRMQNRLQAVNRNLLQADPRTALARQELDAIQRDLANGQTSVRSFMNTYDGINAAKRSRGLFDLQSKDRKYARQAIDQIRDVVRDEILDSGSAFPEAINKWKSGLNAWATIHKSNEVRQWVEDLARGPYAKILTGPAAALFGLGSYGAIKAPIISGPASVAIPVGYKSAQTLYRVWNNRDLSKYYWDAIRETTADNVPAFINNYSKLNKGLEKEEKLESAQIKTKPKKN